MENINIGNMQSISRLQEAQPTEVVQRKFKPKQSAFIERLERIKSDDVRVKLEELYEEIVDKSEGLKETLSLKNVMEYKNLVKNFMKIASENSHVFAQKNFLDRRGRHRVQSIVKQVDRELNEITQEFVKSHIDHAKVLKNIDEIRGMLIDIMM